MKSQEHPERTELASYSSSRRRNWSRRLDRWPLLRLLAHSPALRIVLRLFVLGVLSVPLTLMKIWRTGTANSPGPRISTVDYIQAWSLKRNAREAESRGDMQNALYAWRAAAANNPSDLQALRGGLQCILRLPAPAEQATSALGLGGRLVKAGETNVADLELLGTVWNRCDLHERTAGLLLSLTNKASPSLNRLRAVACFRSGRVSSFIALVNQDPALSLELRQALSSDAGAVTGTTPEIEFRLVSLAYLAGWGSEAERPEARRRLEALAQAAPEDVLVQEMLMAVCVQMRDVERAGEVFRRMQAGGRSTVLQLTSYCGLLARVGQKEEGVRLLREANPVPKTDTDVLRLVDVQQQLDLLEDAESLCRGYLNEMPWLEYGAVIRFELLERLKRWDEVRALAYRLRNYPDLAGSLGGFSYFLEGMAELHEGRLGNVDTNFTRAVELGFPDPRLALRVAQSMLKYPGGQFAGFAQQILLDPRVQAAYPNDITYFSQLMQCAVLRKRDDYLWTAVTNLHLLAPSDPMVVNNYAATLLLLRTNTEEAIVHTLRLLQAFPNAPEAIINHATALTMNGRLDEADALFARILPDRLDSDSVRAQYYLGLFDLRLQQGRKAEARVALRAIDTTQLFPRQVQWLEAEAPKAEDTSSPPAPTGS